MKDVRKIALSVPFRADVTGRECAVCERRVKRGEKVALTIGLAPEHYVHVTCAKNAGMKVGK